MRHAIGAGALGPVYRAHEADNDRDVAVKVFRLDLPPERVHEFVGQLQRMIAVGVSHPSLVAPVEAAISGTLPYLVQELAEGESLDVVMRDRIARPPADALRLVSQVAGALDAAAVKGLLHGALHPRDLLAADTELVRLTGVGIAQSVEAAAAGVPVRRPYAAPERVTGVRWDRRADVFSLAALAHELLWARRVTGVGEQAANALDEIRGGNLTALRRVFAQALAPSPGDRFETAGAFAATLSECFDVVGHAAIRVAAPRRQQHQPRPTPSSRTPPSFESRLPLESGEPLAIAAAPFTSPESESARRAEPDSPVPVGEPPARDLATAPPASEVPAPPRATRVIREPLFDPPLAPVRLDVRTSDSPDHGSVGRLHRRAERTATLPPTPERPLPLAEPEEPEPSGSGIWTLALTALVFLAMGFAGGYWVASQNQLAAPVAIAPPTAAPVMAPPAPVPAPPAAPPASATAPLAIGNATTPSTPEPVAAATSIPAPVEPPPAANDVVSDPRPAAPPQTTPPPATRRSAPRPVSPPSAARRRAAPIPAARAAATAPVTRPVTNAPGALQIDSRPPGANVYVDGQLRGQTPLLVDAVNPGEHGIRLQLDGYVEWLDAVQVAAGGKRRVAASLEPRP